jgi:hypothetical protein
VKTFPWSPWMVLAHPPGIRAEAGEPPLADPPLRARGTAAAFRDW